MAFFNLENIVELKKAARSQSWKYWLGNLCVWFRSKRRATRSD